MTSSVASGAQANSTQLAGPAERFGPQPVMLHHNPRRIHPALPGLPPPTLHEVDVQEQRHQRRIRRQEHMLRDIALAL